MSTLDDSLRTAGAPADADAAPGTFALIPYVHVADIARSIAFYGRLGLTLADTHELHGATVWAHLTNRESRLFLVLADAPIDPAAQAVLFYLWTDDVAALRDHLIANHVPVGAITYPPYMAGGEIRLVDPDRYVILVGQPRTSAAAPTAANTST
jgi:catechol 2,3-dioxygenase-like lactoylglutathione lyase family enzyme